MAIENNIEFLTNNTTATVTASQRRFVTLLERLAEERPDEVDIVAWPEENNGYIMAHIPTSWIRIRPQRILTDEQRAILSRRARINFKHGKRSGETINAADFDEA